EHRKIESARRPGGEAQGSQAWVDLRDARQLEAGRGEDRGERIGVVRDHAPSAQRRLHSSSPAAAERVVDDIRFAGKAVDEISWKLGLEAGPVRNLMNRARPTWAAPSK